MSKLIEISFSGFCICGCPMKFSKFVNFWSRWDIVATTTNPIVSWHFSRGYLRQNCLTVNIGWNQLFRFCICACPKKNRKFRKPNREGYWCDTKTIPIRICCCFSEKWNVCSRYSKKKGIKSEKQKMRFPSLAKGNEECDSTDQSATRRCESDGSKASLWWY